VKRNIEKMNINTEKQYKDVLNRIEWCCINRHGVIKNVSKKDQSIVSSAINHFFGLKGQWWKKSESDESRMMDVEFAHAGDRPWHWCGKTILFKDWKLREENDEKIKSTLKIGETVDFIFRGKKFQGIISSLNKSAKIIIPGDQNWYYIPYSLLSKIQKGL